MEEIGENIPVIKLVEINSIIKTQNPATVNKNSLKIPKICHILSQHSAKVIHERPWKCTYECDKSYITKSDLNKHIRTHHNPYSCKFCTENYVESPKRVRIEFSCKICKAPYSKKRNLCKHYHEKHIMQKISCPFCPDKEFCENHQLKRHIIDYHTDIFIKKFHARFGRVK